MTDLKQFKKRLENNICPFCKEKLKYYDGALGYEAYKCKDCDLTINHNGLYFGN